MKGLLVLFVSIALAVGIPNTKVPFSTQLFGEILAANPRKNVIFSPASIEFALGLVYMGAEGATETALYAGLQLKGITKEEDGAEFGKFLKKDESNGDFELITANRIYLSTRYTIAETYSELVSKYFGNATDFVDFTESDDAAGKINSWVEEQTNYKIQNLVDPSSIDGSTQSVLVNAIYFKAQWLNTFEKSWTQESPFYMDKAHSWPVKMMYKPMDIAYTELPDLIAKAIELPYAGTDIRMLVILPNEIDGLANLETKLKEVDLTQFHMEVNRVNVKFPKFKIEFKTKLKDVLKNFDISYIFKDGDFSSMVTTGGDQLKVSDVIHKAFIEVDENGTEAAVTNAHPIIYKEIDGNDDIDDYDFFVNHPFFFAIKDDNTVYFAGHVTKL